MRKERTSYSKEFKIKAVELSKERGNTKSVIQELNIGRESLRRWIEQYNEGKFSGGKEREKKNSDHEELTRLKKELYDVKMERDILKKAVGIFSKSDR